MIFYYLLFIVVCAGALYLLRATPLRLSASSSPPTAPSAPAKKNKKRKQQASSSSSPPHASTVPPATATAKSDVTFDDASATNDAQPSLAVESSSPAQPLSKKALKKQQQQQQQQQQPLSDDLPKSQVDPAPRRQPKKKTVTPLTKPDISLYASGSIFDALGPQGSGSNNNAAVSGSENDADLSTGMTVNWVDSDEEPAPPPARVLKIKTLPDDGFGGQVVKSRSASSGGTSSTSSQGLTKTQRRNAKKRAEAREATAERNKEQEARSMQYRLGQMREIDNKATRVAPRVERVDAKEAANKWKSFTGAPASAREQSEAPEPASPVEAIAPAKQSNVLSSADERMYSPSEEDEGWTMVKNAAGSTPSSRAASSSGVSKRDTKKQQQPYTDPGNRFLWGM
ncbi:hypothetical protein RI367_006536 [Sorochytrium milnesiophthora]